MVYQVAVSWLYRRTGSPKVLVKGLQPLPLVRRVKVIPPSVENDAPEKLLLFAHRESLKAAPICRRLSGLAVVYVSDWITWGEVSVPVTRSTSAAPYARGTGSNFWTN